MDTNGGEIKIPADGEVQWEGRRVLSSVGSWMAENSHFQCLQEDSTEREAPSTLPGNSRCLSTIPLLCPLPQAAGTEQGSSEQLNTKHRQQLSFINNKNSTNSPCPGWFNPEYFHAWAVPTGKETTSTKPNTQQTKKTIKKNPNTTQLPLQLPKNLGCITFGRGSSWQAVGAAENGICQEFNTQISDRTEAVPFQSPGAAPDIWIHSSRTKIPPGFTPTTLEAANPHPPHFFVAFLVCFRPLTPEKWTQIVLKPWEGVGKPWKFPHFQESAGAKQRLENWTDNYTDNPDQLIHYQPGNIWPVKTPFPASSSPAPLITPAGESREKREIWRKRRVRKSPFGWY